MLNRIPVSRWVIAALAVCALSALSPAAAAEGDTPSEKSLKFKPPPGGAPAGRIGAGTRSFRFAGSTPLTLLSPQGGGLTATGRPILAWQIKDGFVGTVAVSVRGTGGAKPTLVDQHSDQYSPGLYGIDLGDFGVELPIGTVFIWEVALIPDSATQPVERAISFVERIEAGLVLGNRSADDKESAREYADTGVWYDALAALLVLGPDRKVSTQYPAQLMSLLRSIGIRFEEN